MSNEFQLSYLNDQEGKIYSSKYKKPNLNHNLHSMVVLAKSYMEDNLIYKTRE